MAKLLSLGLGAVLAAGSAFCVEESTPESIEMSREMGRRLYIGNCLACHGRSGKGDGDMAVDLSARPTDLSSTDLEDLPDGTLFRIITRGKRPMPKFAGLLTEQERRDLVHYVRTLAAADCKTAEK